MSKQRGLSLVELMIVMLLSSFVIFEAATIMKLLFRENSLVQEKIESERALYEASYYLKMIFSQAIDLTAVNPIAMGGSQKGQIVNAPFVFSNLPMDGKTYIVGVFHRENGSGQPVNSPSSFSKTLIAYRTGLSSAEPGTLLIDMGSGGAGGNISFELQYPRFSYFAVTNVQLDPLNQTAPISITLDLRVRSFLDLASSGGIKNYQTSPTPPPSGTRIIPYKDIQQTLVIVFFNNIISQGGLTEATGRPVRPEQGLYFFKPILPIYK